MSENNMKYRDLCSTCKNILKCTFQRDSQKPVLNCEEFEVEACPSVKTAGEEKSPVTTSVNPENEDAGKFMGLCSNCDNRKTCVFPKSQGGIWHCEEYQ